MITDDDKAEAAHNSLAESDEEFGRLSAYVKMAPHITKLIKAKAFLDAAGTVAEREAMAYASKDYKEFTDKLSEAMVEYEILDARRESWQGEVDIWRTVSANRRK